MGVSFESSQLVGWLVSLVNFAIMFALFRLVVILPMEEAGRLRKQRVALRLKEIEDVASQAKTKLAEFQEKFGGVEAVLAGMASAAERTVAQAKAKLEEKASAQESYVLERAKAEAKALGHEVEQEIRSRIAGQAVIRAQELLAEVLDAKAQNALLAADVKKVGELRAT